ncbi:gtp-binding protein 2-like protein [Lasius niger]|uniref:Gtp-binding protein 2-like protein n=1 Tax=Lasius niger TaxID=67767 RepID=A0A0J7KL69_LASNI|nr:gtp-binding protein 2-like protein [Lasius niger]
MMNKDMESFLQLFNPQDDKDIRKRQWGDFENGNGLSDCETSSTDEDQEDCLPPEPEQGNIEYKLKLINPSSQRFEHLVTQMKWRLREGHGEAIYQIGVEDNGKLAGLTKEEMKASLKTLKDMASRLGATIRILRERIATSSTNNTLASQNRNNNINKEEKKVAEVLVKKLRKDDREDQDSIVDLRLAVIGAQDAGKSTLLGVLTQGELDNGRGRARLNMLRHLHEIKTGRTSSISHEIIGFDSTGHILNYAEMATAEEICEHASKVVTFIDLAGHRKYLRTTVLGLTGFCDMSETLVQLEDAMMTQGYPKQLVLFSNNDIPSWDCTSDVIPVFSVSCVTGEGLEELTAFIKNLAPYEMNSIDSDPESCLFQIDETFRVAGLTQPVLGGLLVKGAIAPGTRLLVGPLPDGEFSPVRVATVLILYHATAIFPGFQTTVHVGNVRQTCVIEGIMDMKDRGLQTNDTASVLFRFVSHPEYLHVGMQLLFREGRTKGIGTITQIFPLIGSQNSIK